MADAIVVRDLSKQYHVGQRHRETMLADVARNLLRWPLRRSSAAGATIWALKDVSFSIRQGEAVGIIGRNGAGKSTLLKLLSRITYPTSGTLKVRGLVASMLEVGTGFHEELTGRENIYLNSAILGMPKKEVNRQFDAIVAFAGVDTFIDTPIKRYSSGMRLRLGFAVAAHLDSDILLVDEVLAVGDAEFQKKCLRSMGDLQNSGRTVLFVSHNLAAVENLCQRGIWIDDGRIRQDGSAREVIEAYMSSVAVGGEGECDLGDMKSRRGTGEIRYTKIEFLDSNNNRRALLRSGDRLLVRLHYRAERQIANPIFGFAIFTELGTRVATVSTWSSGFDIPCVPPGDGHIDVELDCLSLMRGRYYLSLLLESALPFHHYDMLDHCVSLNVETSDVHGSGRGADGYFGIVFLPCRWQFDGLHEGKISR